MGRLFCVLAFVFLNLFFGQNQVQDDGENEYDGNAVFGEDGLDDLRENLEHFGCRSETETRA